MPSDAVTYAASATQSADRAAKLLHSSKGLIDDIGGTMPGQGGPGIIALANAVRDLSSAVALIAQSLAER